MLSYTFINSHSQVSDPGPKGPLDEDMQSSNHLTREERVGCFMYCVGFMLIMSFESFLVRQSSRQGNEGQLFCVLWWFHFDPWFLRTCGQAIISPGNRRLVYLVLRWFHVTMCFCRLAGYVLVVGFFVL